MSKPTVPKKILPLVILLSTVTVTLIACKQEKTIVQLPPEQSKVEPEDPAKKVHQIIGSEELILSLQRDLNTFSKSAKNLQIPDWQTNKYFEPSFSARLLTNQNNTTQDTLIGVTSKKWQTEDNLEIIAFSDHKLLEPLLDNFLYLDKFKLKIIRGKFSETNNEFLTHGAISGAGKLNTKNWASFEGIIDLTWKKSTENEWRIANWDLKHLNSYEDSSSSRMFARTNQTAIPNAQERDSAEFSIHEDMVKSIALNGRCTPPGGKKFEFKFTYESAAATPAVSVVDINNDGLDDFYLVPRWGKCQLFINQGDSTFKESAAQYGLDIMNHCNAAAFADFDNDGDQDVIIARSFDRSLYLENNGNTFIDASHKVAEQLPAMATSVTVTDYNRDGLLDVFITTYGTNGPLKKFQPHSDLITMATILTKGENHELFNSLGPPNILLVNQGKGTFEKAPESSQLAQWLKSLTSAWVDYDQDGDPDVYISNDFGPDALFRNDYPDGFVDVTTSEGHETMAGFGMGITCGDYDLDGKQDLYISNMYSKAGTRIAGQIENIDPRFTGFTNGNRLYRHGGQQFELTSGFKLPKHPVAKVGWSWGGQFADFDNNGYLDLYVPTGYFTAPADVAHEDDL